jgi:hypothetical protein
VAVVLLLADDVPDDVPGSRMRKSAIVLIAVMGSMIAVTGLAADRTAAGPEARPIIDNERVAVFDTTDSLPAAPHDFVAISLANGGNALFGRAGDTAGNSLSRTVVIELKDHPLAPIENRSGFPNAYPRPRIEKMLENDRVIVWRYRWNLGEPTPMHFHDKDVVVVYLEDSALKSTEPDGKSVLNEYKSGDIRFNRRDRVHTELLVRDSASAVITELK